jgi:hypothetical protein
MLRVWFIFLILVFYGCFDNKNSPKKENNVTLKKENNITREKNETIPKRRDLVVDNQERLELRSDFDLYLEYLRTLNTNGIVEMTYPRLFIPINKNMFIRFINTLLDSPEIAIESFDANITNIGDIIDYGSGKFANLEYVYAIKLAFVNPNLYKDKISMKVLQRVLEKKYGRKNILVDRDTRTVMIKKREKLLAIKDENSTSWKFLGDNSEYRKLYPDILPKEILELLEPL